MESRMLPLVQIHQSRGVFQHCRLLHRPAAGRCRRHHPDDDQSWLLWWKAKPGGFTPFYDALHAGNRGTDSGNRGTRDGVLDRTYLPPVPPSAKGPLTFSNYTASPAALPGRQILYFYNRTGSPHYCTQARRSRQPILVNIAPSGRGRRQSGSSSPQPRATPSQSPSLSCTSIFGQAWKIATGSNFSRGRPPGIISSSAVTCRNCKTRP